MSEIFFLDIKEFTKRGYGKGDGFEIFGTVPGDQVEAEKIRRGKARLKKIITPSKNRIAARCAHAGVCGGCAFQELAYPTQLELKQTHIEKLFSTKANAIIPCDPPFHHRNKMEYTFSQDKAGQRFLGLHRPQAKGRVVDIEKCELTGPWFSQTLKAVRQWWEETDLKAYHPHHNVGTLRTLTLREGKRTGKKMALLTLSSKARDSITKKQLEDFKNIFDDDTSVFLILHKAEKGYATQMFEMHLKGPDHLKEELHVSGRTLGCTISSLSFFQPNTFQAEKLYTHALSLIPQPLDGPILDLYAGAATLGMVFSPLTEQVISIEQNIYSSLDAEENIKHNQIKNITFIRGDVEDHLSDLPSPALAIIDPPRAGLGPKSCAELAALKPQKIIYISCNPETQSHDLQRLQDYKLIQMQPVDQFPHTPHIENIAYLEKM